MIDLLEALSNVITCLFLRSAFSMIGLLGACDFPHCCLWFIFSLIFLWVDSIFSSGCKHKLFTISLACLISVGLSLVHLRGDLCDYFTLTIWFHFYCWFPMASSWFDCWFCLAGCLRGPHRLSILSLQLRCPTCTWCCVDLRPLCLLAGLLTVVFSSNVVPPRFVISTNTIAQSFPYVFSLLHRLGYP